MTDPFFEFRLAIVPVAKERPRANRKTGSVYTPSRTRKYEEELAKAFRATGVQPNEVDDLGVFCRFFLTGRRRRDGDNLLKAVQDAGNGIVWADDRQIVDGRYRVHYGQAEDAIELTVWVEGAGEARPQQNARSRSIKRQERALPTGYDLCPACGRRAKQVTATTCRSCA